MLDKLCCYANLVVLVWALCEGNEQCTTVMQAASAAFGSRRTQVLISSSILQPSHGRYQQLQAQTRKGPLSDDGRQSAMLYVVSACFPLRCAHNVCCKGVMLRNWGPAQSS